MPLKIEQANVSAKNTGSEPGIFVYGSRTPWYNMNIDWQTLGAALALMFIFEGMLPFLLPNRLRVAALTVLQLDNKSLRLMGLGSMVLGLVLLYVIR